MKTAIQTFDEIINDMPVSETAFNIAKEATQKQWVEGRTYHYGILGDIKDLDTMYLSTIGPVKIVTLEEIFGY